MLPATGCPTTTAVSSVGSPRSSPASLDFISTALEAYYTAAPVSARLQSRCAEKPKAEVYPVLRLHIEVIYDPNIGTRDRLPVCNPNPNRVKETEKGPGVADVTGTPVTTATAWGKVLVRQEKKRVPYGSKQRRGSLTLNP